MLFTIDHTTEYRFTRPVFFEPHQLRMCPRSDGSQRVVRFALQIEPTPTGVTQSLDVAGNVVTMAWFGDVYDRMVLRASSEVETLRDNPYDFLLTPTNQRLPIGYQPWEAALLGPALRRTVPIHVDPARELAEQLREASRSEVVPFLSRLTETICNRFKVIHRETGGPWPPAPTTIEQRQGACRDLAVLWIDICRSVGLAARFVSGYQEGDADQDKQRFLHSWAEVYLPGAGWRGFDPTHGLAVADRHVAVAAAADAMHAAPVSATYRGNNVEAELHAEVIIERESAVEVAAC